MSAFAGPSSLKTPSKPSGARRARHLEAHQVELLTEAVQPRRACVTGVALQVVLARERRDGFRGLHLHVSAERGDERHEQDHALGHAVSLVNDVADP